MLPLPPPPNRARKMSATTPPPTDPTRAKLGLPPQMDVGPYAYATRKILTFTVYFCILKTGGQFQLSNYSLIPRFKTTIFVCCCTLPWLKPATGRPCVLWHCQMLCFDAALSSGFLVILAPKTFPVLYCIYARQCNFTVYPYHISTHHPHKINKTYILLCCTMFKSEVDTRI